MSFWLIERDMQYIDRGYKGDEIKTLRLFEDLHFAAFAWRDTLNIISGIIEYMFCFYNKQNFAFVATQFKDITFPLNIGEPILVCVRYTHKTSSVRVNYSRNSKGTIILSVFINPNTKIGSLDIGLIREYLDHEVLHIVEDNGRLAHKADTAYGAALKNLKIDSESFNKNLYQNTNNNVVCPEFLIYRLFMSTEFYAFINQVPQSLKNINAIGRENYKDDIKRTFVYREYKAMRDYLPYLKKKDDWISQTKFYFKKYPNMSDENFKKYFISFCEKRLDEMWKEMSKIACSYYLVQEHMSGKWNNIQRFLLKFDTKDKLSKNIKNMIFQNFEPYSNTFQVQIYGLVTKSETNMMIDSDIVEKFYVYYNSSQKLTTLIPITTK